MTSERFPVPEDFPDREVLTWEGFGHAMRDLARSVVASAWLPEAVVAIARGGLIPAGGIAYALDAKAMGTVNVEFYTGVGTTLIDPVVLPPALDVNDLRGRRVLVVDDVADSGRTLLLVQQLLSEQGCEVRTAVIYAKPTSVIVPDYAWRRADAWVMFPWSSLPPVTGTGQADA